MICRILTRSYWGCIIPFSVAGCFNTINNLEGRDLEIYLGIKACCMVHLHRTGYLLFRNGFQYRFHGHEGVSTGIGGYLYALA